MKTLILFLKLSIISILIFGCKTEKKQTEANQESGGSTVHPCKQSVATPIQQTLRGILADDIGTIPENDRKFSYAVHDMNGDGIDEYFVAMVSPHFCGSGGCMAYVLNQDMSVLSRFTAMNFPVYVSTKFMTHGYADIYALSNGAYHMLKFDGHRYPSNPSAQPVVQPDSYPEKKILLEKAYEEKCDF